MKDPEAILKTLSDFQSEGFTRNARRMIQSGIDNPLKSSRQTAFCDQ